MMKSIQFTTLQKRILFYFLITSILALLLAFGLIYVQVSRNIKELEIDKLASIRDLKTNRILSWLEERKGDILVIATDREIRAMEFLFLDQEQNHEEKSLIVTNARQHLDRYLDNYPDYQELMIIHPETGRIVLSTIQEREKTNVSDRPYFQVSHRSEQVSIQQIQYSEYLKRNTLDLSVPIYCLEHEGDHVIGILVARVNPEISLYPLLANTTGLGLTGETLIVNREQLAQNPLRWQKEAALHLKIDSIAAAKVSQGLSGVVETIDYRGEKVLTAYTYLPEIGWGLIAKQDLQEVYTPLSMMVNRFLLLFIGISFFIYLVSRGVSQAISQPISKMSQVSAKIQEGDYSQRLDEAGFDEISQLARTMNQTARSIQQEIEIRNVRTRILERIIHSRDLHHFSQEIISQLCQSTHSQVCVFYRFNQEKNQFEHLASVGMDKNRIQSFDVGYREGILGQVVNKKDMVYLREIPEDTRFIYKTVTGHMLPKEMIAFPLILNHIVEGVIVIASIYPYPHEVLEMIKQSKTQMAIMMENILADEKAQQLSQEIQEKNESLIRLTGELKEQAEELKNQKEELQHQNIELELQKSEIQETGRLKGEFLSNMSHELRTPLNSIIALSDILELQLNQNISQEQQQYLRVIARNGRNLLNLINDILDLSKIEAGKISIYPERFSLDQTVSQVIENFLFQAQEKGIELKSEISQGLPDILTDRQKVTQILQNLISNAVKFTEKGSVTVNLSFNKEDNRFLLRVLDTGIGISQEDLPTIFEEFKQIDGSVSRKYEGTGLGLAIVSRLVNRLKGEIYVESQLGKGSTFTVLFPREIQDHSTAFLLSGESGHQTEPFSRKKETNHKHLLLVEDNPTAQSQIRYLLEQAGYGFAIARGGEDALDYLKDHIPDGIILDLMMPEIDGFQVLQEMRRDNRFRFIPVLVLTAKDLTEEEIKLLQYNHISQLVFKGSLNRADLLEKIEVMLNQNKEAEDKEKVINGSLTEHRSLPQSGDSPKRENSERTSILKNQDHFNQKILIAEDNADNLLTIRAILKNHYRLSEAKTGQEALQKAFTEKPDLIILDIGLPELDGYQVIQKLKNSAETKLIPIIALTARAMMGERERIMEEGSDDYLSKPVDISVLFEKIEQWLNKK